MPSDDELAIAINLYETSTNTVYTLWNFFSIVALAVVGFVFREKTALLKWGRLAIVVVFLLFSTANILSIIQAQEIRVAASEVAEQAVHGNRGGGMKKYNLMLSEVDAVSVWRVGAFHCVLTSIIVAAVFLAGAIKGAESTRQPPSPTPAADG